MKKINYAVCALALVLTSSAYAETASKDHTESTVTREGNAVERTTTRERSNDPDGLGNKTWSKEEVKAKLDTDGESSETTTHKSVDSAGTSHKIEESTAKNIKSDGTVETETDKEIVTDPKGLGNKTKTSVERTTKKHPDGTVDTTEKVDGKVVR